MAKPGGNMVPSDHTDWRPTHSSHAEIKTNALNSMPMFRITITKGILWMGALRYPTKVSTSRARALSLSRSLARSLARSLLPSPFSLSLLALQRWNSCLLSPFSLSLYFPLEVCLTVLIGIPFSICSSHIFVETYLSYLSTRGQWKSRIFLQLA